MKKIRLAIVIPTRNRADIAVNSVISVVQSYAGDDVGIIISDNSTDISESATLDLFSITMDNRVKIIRPIVPLGMTAHWNFAVEHAMADRSFTHFTVLTDRMLFKSGSIYDLLAIINKFPTDVVSYTYDRIQDVGHPIIFKPLPRSNGLIRIDSSRMLDLSAAMRFPSCLPRMLNSISPREHFQSLKICFGSIFSSIAPDFNFCYRTLDISRSFIFYDKSLMINYSQGRSNGASFARAVMTKDSKDFIANIGSIAMNSCAPIPEIITVGNSIVHEYQLAKASSKSGDFLEISTGAYLDFLASEVLNFENASETRKALVVLRKNGWRPRVLFYFGGWKSKFIAFILSFTWRKFDSVDDAISYACAHAGFGCILLPHSAHRYGRKLRTSKTRTTRVDAGG